MSRAVHSSLFRSADGGATWISVLRPGWQLGRPVALAVYAPIFGLSRDFSADGMGLTALNTYSLVQYVGSCEVFGTDDRGATWAVRSATVGRNPSGPLRPCWNFLAGGTADGFSAYAAQGLGVDNSRIWSSSTDGGYTWRRLGMPADLRYSDSEAVLAPDGTVFFLGSGGIWALGPSARPAGGGP